MSINTNNKTQLKHNYRKQFDNIITRVLKKNALGIIYNVPKMYMSLIVNRLLDEKVHIAINGRNAYTYEMLFWRLSSYFKIKRIKPEMLPAALNGKILTIYNADYIQKNFARVIDECSKNKVPLLLLFNTEQPLDLLRSFYSYQRVLSIEQDYNLFFK